MAEWRLTEETHDVLDQFSVLDGVRVRVGEKFKASKSVESDVAIVTVNDSDYMFDFSLERLTIEAFESEQEEERIKLEQAELESRDGDDARDAGQSAVSSSDEPTLEASSGDRNLILHGDKVVADGGNNAPSAAIRAVQPVLPASWSSSSTILEPTKLYGHPGLFEDNFSTVPRTINISEFEDNNVTPFELVEMQSINEFDELMSVLQPGGPLRPRQQVTTASVNGDVPSPRSDTQSPTAQATQLVDCGNNSIPNTGSYDMYGPPYAGGYPSVNPEQHLFAWGHSDSLFREHTAADGLSSSTKNSKSLPDLASIGRDAEQEYEINSGSPGRSTLPLCSTFPVEGELQERSLSAGSRIQSLGVSAPVASSAVEENNQSLVTTNRINNIMNQYRFTRLHRDGPANTSGGLEHQLNRAVDDVPPWKRCPVLPPLPASQQSASTSPINVPFSSPQSMTRTPRSESTSVVGPSSVENVQIHSNLRQLQVSYCKQPSTPPPIKKRSPDRTSTDSALADTNDYSALNSDEKEFASNLESMGFPLPRIIRAVGHHGCNDKEVLDFLLIVQQLIDLGHKEHDAEMVLTEVNNNYDQAVIYLETVRRLTHLGFSNKSIINALKSTQGDIEAALEMLMS